MNTIGRKGLYLSLMDFEYFNFVGFRFYTYLTKKTGKVMEIQWLNVFIIVYILYFVTLEYNIAYK